jgi:CspA family cold shock protein
MPETGRVKWFNNKTGFGFITVTDGEHSGKDIFVHHSALKVENEQYKYLVQGEYVQFELVKSQNSGYEFQASNVCGINSGKLMCETRTEFRNTKNTYRQERQEKPVSKPVPKQQVSTKSEPNPEKWTTYNKQNSKKSRVQKK